MTATRESPQTESENAKHDPTQWREIYSTNPGDYYADTIEVAPDCALRISSEGRVSCRPSIRALLDELWRDIKVEPLP